MGAFLLPIKPLLQRGFQFVLILPFGTQDPPIEDMGLRSIMSNRHMDFSQVNACYLLSPRLCSCLNLIGCDGFVLSPCPVDHHRLRGLPRPIKHKRSIATAIGKGEFAVLVAHGCTLVLDTKEVPASAGELGMRLSCVALTARLWIGIERFYACNAS